MFERIRGYSGVWACAVLTALTQPFSPALAAYPEKPIRFIIPSAPGGSPDVIMRLLMNQMSNQMGVPIVVENKPGGSYFIGTSEIVRAAPDGYTLGYGTGPVRLDAFSDLPAIQEVVPGYQTVAWGGVIGPAGLPVEVVSRLQAELKKALQAPSVTEVLNKLQVGIDGGTSEAFRELVRRETPKWADVVRRSGAKVD